VENMTRTERCLGVVHLTERGPPAELLLHVRALVAGARVCPREANPGAAGVFVTRRRSFLDIFASPAPRAGVP
jgi:hypothetical protein